MKNESSTLLVSNFPADLRIKLKIFSFKSSTTMSKVVIESVKKHLEKHSENDPDPSVFEEYV